MSRRSLSSSVRGDSYTYPLENHEAGAFERPQSIWPEILCLLIPALILLVGLMVICGILFGMSLGTLTQVN